MDRRSVIKNAGLAGVLAAGVAPAIVHAQANVRWRLVSSFPKSADAIFGGAEVFVAAGGPERLDGGTPFFTEGGTPFFFALFKGSSSGGARAVEGPWGSSDRSRYGSALKREGYAMF